MVVPIFFNPWVKKGAEWLDANYPGWASRINLDTLDLHRNDACVLGQLAPRGGYILFVVAFGLTITWCMNHGFLRREDNTYWDNWFYLTESWKVEVRARLPQASLVEESVAEERELVLV